MKKLTFFIFVASLITVFATTSQANTISQVLSGSDNGFGFSGLHYATGNQSMSGSNFSSVSLDTNFTSFFHIDDHSGNNNFELHLILDDKGGSLLTLSGVLDFRVAAGELLGTLNADFSDPSVHADTFFKFVQGTTSVGGNGVPNPNGINGDLLALWGANSTADHLPNSIGFDPSTADLGIDLVVRWVEVPAPDSVALLALGLLGLGFARRKQS
ncbi:MAG: PEP-CTERM sorting domain-containing protein [Betaproteobacteria bacterium]|nr:PEP-CTERM sorting domain-containing protein [Betaproteobacteria bacterium]